MGPINSSVDRSFPPPSFAVPANPNDPPTYAAATGSSGSLGGDDSAHSSRRSSTAEFQERPPMNFGQAGSRRASRQLGSRQQSLLRFNSITDEALEEERRKERERQRQLQQQLEQLSPRENDEDEISKF